MLNMFSNTVFIFLLTISVKKKYAIYPKVFGTQNIVRVHNHMCYVVLTDRSLV